MTAAVTLITESRGSQVAAAGRKTFPGIVASAVFEVITAASTVASRLAGVLAGLEHQYGTTVGGPAPGRGTVVCPVKVSTLAHHSSSSPANRRWPADTA